VPDHDHASGVLDGLTHHRCNWPISQRVRRYLADPPGRDLGLVVPADKLAELERHARDGQARRKRAAQARRVGREQAKAGPQSDEEFARRVQAALEQTTEQGG